MGNNGGDKMNCMWCKTPLKDGHFYCAGGGKVFGISNTGEKSMTKSFCYDSFIKMFKMTVKLRTGLTEQEQQYLLWKDQIREWYQGLTMFFSKTGKEVPQNALDS